MHSKCLYLLGLACLAASGSAVEPADVYDGNGASKDAEIILKIGNGGAGQSGLVGALANAFVEESVKKNGSDPFRVAWYKSDTTQSINYLKAEVVDVAITYTQSAEEVAGPIYYLFRDHFLFVGPPENPANVSETDDLKTLFSKLYGAAELQNSTIPVRFLSRYDKSATNIKDAQLFINIGQTPWANPGSTWYHEYIAYPIQALTAAALLKEYTITDRGTMLSLAALDESIVKQTTIYKKATNNEDDLLLNPAHLLIGSHAPKIAQTFTDWATGPIGQKVIANFEKNGEKLYDEAPAQKTIDVPVTGQVGTQKLLNQGTKEWTIVVRPGL